jgi:hypothetical protein
MWRPCRAIEDQKRQAGDANKEAGVKTVDLGQHSSLDLPLSLAQL